MIVIDASVANKLFLIYEVGYNQVKGIFKEHTNGTQKILVPDLIFYEVANTLTTKLIVPKIKITQALNRLGDYNLEIFRPSVEELIKATSFAKDNHVSVYDAVYAVLAREKKCDLITADEKFVKQVNLPFVKALSEYPEV